MTTKKQAQPKVMLMANDANAKESESKKKQPINLKILVLVITGLLILLVSLWVFHITHNYAKDVAKPLDKALVAGGASKRCEASGLGRGPDDFTPGYTAYYETLLNHDQAVMLISKSAAENGFKLKQATHGDLPSVGDAYISNYYIDHSSKISKLPGADQGPVELIIALGNAFEADSNKPYTILHPFCNKNNDVIINNDSTHTAIELDLKLPRNKW